MNVNELLHRVFAGVMTLEAALQELPVGEPRNFLAKLSGEITRRLFEGTSPLEEKKRLEGLLKEVDSKKGRAASVLPAVNEPA